MHKLSATKQKGQALIVVIFVLLVAALIILAASARSLTDIRISETSEDSARAFSAAEAGIEQAVEQIRVAVASSTNAPPGQTITLPNASTATYVITPQSGSTAFLSADRLSSDLQTFQVYLANSTNLLTGNYRGNFICLMWGDTDSAGVPVSGPIPAIEASVVYQATVAPLTRVARFPLDPDAGRRFSNSFITPTDDGVGGACQQNIAATDSNLGVVRSFAYRHKLSLQPSALPDLANTCDGGSRPCVQVLRTRLLYNSSAQYAGVQRHGGFDLPLQGHSINSTGQVGQTARRVNVYRSLESVPTIFDFAIFNGSTNPLAK